MSILERAAAIVDGDREGTYGDPGKNLSTIAQFWTVFLKSRGVLAPNADLTIQDVAVMMTQLKIARLANNPGHVDSLVDACGYLYLIERTQK